MICNLNKNWDSVIWYKGKNKLLTALRTFDDRGCDFISRHEMEYEDEVRFFGVLGDTGYCQIDTELAERDIFIGHPIICDRKDVMISIAKCGKEGFSFEVHNPSDNAVKCTVSNAPQLTEAGAFSVKLNIPAGSSLQITVDPQGNAKIK